MVEFVEDRIGHFRHAIVGDFDHFRSFERFDLAIGGRQLAMKHRCVVGHSIVDVFLVLGRLCDAVASKQLGDLAHGYEFHLMFSVLGGIPPTGIFNTMQTGIAS